jgi:hypothetical protein
MRLFRLLVAMLSLATAGCAGQGMLYTRVVSPYSTDFHATPAGSKTCRVNEYILKDPVGGTHVSVDYTLRVVQKAAREAGITNLYYADLETFSILQGIYTRKTLILSGD